MKKNLTALGLALSGVFMTSATSSAEMIGNMDFPGFAARIECRQPSLAPGERAIPQNYTELLRKAAVPSSTSRFEGWNPVHPDRPAFAKTRSASGEKLDSIVSVYLNGEKRSKQEFVFSETGRPLESRNFLPSADGNGFVYAGHYLYEYDDMGRLILAEKTDLDYLSSNQKMEYIYDGSNPRYSMQIAYLMNEEAEWIPFQKGEYEFDEQGNTVKETYFSWNDDADDWQRVQKVEASYNEMGWMTSYFKYTSWDGSDWSAEPNATDGHTYIYTQDGQDAEVVDFIWYDGGYLAYHRNLFTYNDAALCIGWDNQYWNRTKQDWSGDETWGRWDYLYSNSTFTYEYNEYGQLTTLNGFAIIEGESINNFRETYTYTDIENDETEVTMLRGTVKADEFSPYTKTVQHFNKFGSENYYISYRENEGELMPLEEQIRYMDDYNFFLGGDYYSFINGERKPSSKELFTYAEDFDPTLGYETPIEGRHWIGTGIGESAEWKLKQVDEFSWGPRDVMTGYTNYDYLQSQGFRTYGWENVFDFSTDMSNVWLWPDPNKGNAYYECQFLESTTFINTQYWNGSDEWMPEISYRNFYHYSSRTTSGVSGIDDSSAVEIARYDQTGRLLSAPTFGVNIVRYSDGSTRKIFVTK